MGEKADEEAVEIGKGQFGEVLVLWADICMHKCRLSALNRNHC